MSSVISSTVPSGRHRRDPGLGAGAFSEGRHGLAEFDGTDLYEHADPRQGEHQDWGTLIFNFGRNEVRNFLIAQRAFLARQISHRRAARGCRGLDALPRLFAEARRMGAERLRRPRESGRHRFPETLQRSLLRAFPGDHDHRGRIDRVARRIASDLSGWARVSASNGTWAGCTISWNT